MRFFFLALLSLIFVFQAKANQELRQKSWQHLVQDSGQLEKFLQAMPKGADLHLHASGAIETENLIKMAIAHHYCVHPDFSLTDSGDDCVDADVYFKDPKHQQAALNAWSMQDFTSQDPKRRADHFFSSFPKIDIMMKAHWPEVIARVLEQAQRQNILYLELMLSMQGHKPQARGLKDENRKDVARFIAANIQQLSKLKANALKLTSPEVKTDCALILEIKRNQPLDQFKLDAYEVFAIANAVPDVLGINLVQPEYEKFAYQDYEQQMLWLKYLKTRFPKKPLVLHAGEIPLMMTETKKPGHIALAIQQAEPLRIGHGVSIMHEANAKQTMDEMRRRDIAVEINLTSNDQILGIKGSEHPLHSYLSHGVAVVISSDDPGISRNNLSHEYFRAVNEQHLSLDEINLANRNSIHYSLLPGQSLWQDIHRASPVKACRQFDSPACLSFIKKQPKAKMEWELEQKLKTYFTHHLG